MRNIIYFIMIISLCGCATEPTREVPVRTEKGIYHRVGKGQTLWRISKLYSISMDTLIESNNLPDATKIATGQLLFIPGAESVRSTPPEGPLDNSQSFVWPLRGQVISFFGARRDNVKNKGIDIHANQGAAVVASRAGVISFCDKQFKGLGGTIIVDHGDGFSTVYAHNSEILVKTGERVRGGQQIARAGKTGRAETAFLHFEIRRHNKPQNPFYYLP